MFQKFNDLFWAINDECKEHLDEDLSLREDAMAGLIDAWTDYMMAQEEAPTEKELEMYHACANLVKTWH